MAEEIKCTQCESTMKVGLLSGQGSIGKLIWGDKLDWKNQAQDDEGVTAYRYEHCGIITLYS